MLITASIGSAFQHGIVDTGREPHFLFFVSFLVTFAFIRTSTHMIRAQVRWWPGNVSVGGTHIHHLVWGILLLLICGYSAVALDPNSPWREVVAVFFGSGRVSPSTSSPSGSISGTSTGRRRGASRSTR